MITSIKEPRLLLVAVRSLPTDNPAEFRALKGTILRMRSVDIIESVIWTSPNKSVAYHAELTEVRGGGFDEVWFVGAQSSTRLLALCEAAINSMKGSVAINFADDGSVLAQILKDFFGLDHPSD